jgi:hypothetical protein
MLEEQVMIMYGNMGRSGHMASEWQDGGKPSVHLNLAQLSPLFRFVRPKKAQLNYT